MFSSFFFNVMIYTDSFGRSVKDRNTEKAYSCSIFDLIKSHTNQHSMVSGKTIGKKSQNKTGTSRLELGKCRQLLFSPEIIQKMNVLETEQTQVKKKVPLPNLTNASFHTWKTSNTFSRKC